MEPTCIAECYRERAAAIEKGLRLKPAASVLIEFRGEDNPGVVLYGATQEMSAAECLALLIDAIGVLSGYASTCNAETAN